MKDELTCMVIAMRRALVEFRTLYGCGGCRRTSKTEPIKKECQIDVHSRHEMDAYALFDSAYNIYDVNNNFLCFFFFFFLYISFAKMQPEGWILYDTEINGLVRLP